MFEKFTFEKKLGIDSSEKQWHGLKIAALFASLAFIGGLLVFLGFEMLGKSFVLLGIFGGFVGIVMGLVMASGQKSENK